MQYTPPNHTKMYKTTAQSRSAMLLFSWNSYGSFQAGPVTAVVITKKSLIVCMYMLHSGLHFLLYSSTYFSLDVRLIIRLVSSFSRRASIIYFGVFCRWSSLNGFRWAANTLVVKCLLDANESNRRRIIIGSKVWPNATTVFFWERARITVVFV